MTQPYLLHKNMDGHERSTFREIRRVQELAAGNFPRKGKVCLVGFGPGDPELITRKGYRLLTQCDMIFYDDLTDHEFLHEFRADKVYVGKRKGHHHVEQEEIHRMLLRAALSGKLVVRLKGGDPMLFAHGGEEAAFLKSHAVEVDVVPGITAALAMSASVQLPMTHRGISSSVTFITGHSMASLRLPDSGTIVIYMGASNLHKIARLAITQGWNPFTPVLLSHHISGINQHDEFSTLGEIAVSAAIYPTPLLVMIGDVLTIRNLQIYNEGSYLNLGI